jgi:hypothetical protein
MVQHGFPVLLQFLHPFLGALKRSDLRLRYLQASSSSSSLVASSSRVMKPYRPPIDSRTRRGSHSELSPACSWKVVRARATNLRSQGGTPVAFLSALEAAPNPERSPALRPTATIWAATPQDVKDGVEDVTQRVRTQPTGQL